MCLNPFRAQSQESGRPLVDSEGDLLLPCGKCSECKTKRAVEWATRCRHEISLHDQNCFLTLTYDDENLPSPFIVKDKFQKFMKKLRKFEKQKNSIRYIVSHEYGGKSGRPHHHAIIFGWEPPSQDYLMKAPSGEPLFTSKTLEKLWTHGYHSIGTANEKTAYYIASYSLKSSEHNILHPDSGEIIKVTDSMNCSVRPAIGKEYFLKNYKDLIHNKEPLPRYYQKLLGQIDENALQIYEDNQAYLNKNKQGRGIHERLAKHVITETQKTLKQTGLRSAPESKNAQEFTRYLTKEREYYTFNKYGGNQC